VDVKREIDSGNSQKQKPRPKAKQENKWAEKKRAFWLRHA